MLRKIRNSEYFRYLWLFMALYILNLSADTQDFHGRLVKEDLTFNDQESLIEFVVEEIIGLDEVFKEYDDPDSEDGSKKLNIKNLNYIPPFLVLNFQENDEPFVLKKNRIPSNLHVLSNDFCKIQLPPPKFLI